jgi:DNA-binding NarL/FixJ family response regulator
VTNPALASWRGELAHAEHLLGHSEEAATLAAQLLELARRWQAPWVLAHSLRVSGVITGGSEGEAELREAIAVAEAGNARLEKARALVALGSLMRRSGSRKESREPLREGLDLALACGARPVVERAHEELVASGAQPRRLRETGPDALTPAERRVAGMAAEGMTNKAIAQTLFVSEKTVETQLGSVYRKLEIGSRSQLAGRIEPAPEPSVT